MTRKQRRLVLIGSGLAVLALAVALVLNALKDSIVFFNSPTDVVEKHVKPGTVTRDNLTTRFEVTDGKEAIAVAYTGILPDLFREGQGVVAEGVLDSGGLLKADTVLAKHDEKYMPKEVADALKKQGRWKEGEGTKTGAAPQGRVQ